MEAFGVFSLTDAVAAWDMRALVLQNRPLAATFVDCLIHILFDFDVAKIGIILILNKKLRQKY